MTSPLTPNQVMNEKQPSKKYMERNHRTYLRNRVVSISNSGSDWCSYPFRRRPFTGKYLAKHLIYKNLERFLISH